LQGDLKSLLSNDDLWLEIALDGEAQPAIAAPARFFFPGLEEGKNYHNFVVVNRGGATNLLAMPFGDGLTLSARNRGTTPLKNVAATLSVEPATDDTRPEILARQRLRGVYREPSTASNLVELTGRGRLVGLLCSGLPQHAVGLVTIDGRGDDAVSLAAFFGISIGDEQRRCLSGRSGDLAWRYLLLAPIDFERSFALRTDSEAATASLALYYGPPH
jgi:hypothetical protein